MPRPPRRTLRPRFDRVDICEAYLVLEWDYNVGGWLHERPSNQRRREATAVQLHRMGFKPHPNLDFSTLTKNGRAIYRELERRYRFNIQRAA
ncbi:hypothetical protein [Caldimonas sp. KR1-144]|uniref:hypothetical protein n=1 Tax=Caldimonas sp. KR1-144 TaxID=3400911 RepID=UPI003C08ECF6